MFFYVVLTPTKMKTLQLPLFTDQPPPFYSIKYEVPTIPVNTGKAMYTFTSVDQSLKCLSLK